MLYAEQMKQDSVFPPIKIAKDKHGRFVIRDGRHRITAAKLIGKTRIMAKFSTKPMEYKNENNSF